jgi:hypothetical protein
MHVCKEETKEVVLPVLGRCTVAEVKNEPGHYLWLDLMGWHDCTRGEDAIIRSQKS